MPAAGIASSLAESAPALQASAPEPAEAQIGPDDGIAEQAIHFYQKYLSSLRHGHCRFDPSCSNYAIEAMRVYGPIEGAARAADRLMRCSAGSERFYDRLPDGRRSDPVAGQTGRQRVRMPGWLLPGPGPKQPPLGLFGGQISGRVSENLSFADELSREGACDQSAVEFHRAAHSVGSPEAHAWAHARSGACYFEEGSWAEAERAFLASAMLATDGTTRRRALLMASACRFNLGDFVGSNRLAEASLEGPDAAIGATGPGESGGSLLVRPVLEIGSTSTDRDRTLGTMGMSQLTRGDWSAARDRFHEAALASENPAVAGRLRFLAARAPAGARLSARSPGLALALSMAVPGAGQAYSGRIREGLQHLIMNAALGYTSVQLFRDRKYAGAYVMTGIAVPFYLGNLHGARDAARDYNRSRRMEFVNSAVGEASH